MTLDDPSVAEAFERVYHAGQELLVRRLEVLLEEGRAMTSSALTAGAGALLALGGWTLLIGGALQALEPGMPRLLAAIALGVAHLVTGGAVAYRALRPRSQAPPR